MGKRHAKHLSTLATIVTIVLLASCQDVKTEVTQVTPTHQAQVPLTNLDVDALRLWGKKDSSVNTKARLGNGAAYALAISPNGETLAVAGALGIATYDFNTLEMLWRSPLELWKELPQSGVTVTWSPDGTQLVTTSNGDALIWDAKTGEQLSKLQDNQRYVDYVSWSPDGQVLAAIVRGDVPTIFLWNTQTGKQIHLLESDNGTKFLGWMEDGGETLKISQNGETILWDIRTGKQSPSLSIDIDRLVGIPSHDGTRLVVLGEFGQMTLWDAQSGKQLPVVYKIPNNGWADIVTWSPNNRLIAAAGADYGKVWIWDADTGKQLYVLERKQTGHTDKVLGLVWSPNGKNLVSLSRYVTITVWDAQTGEELRSLDDHTGWVLSLAWSPGGDILASGSEDGEITLWDPLTGKKLLSFRDPTGWVHSLAWSPDGKRLASGGSGALTIWEAQTGRQLKVLSGLRLAVTRVAWSPDGKMLASTSYDVHGMIWDGLSYEKLRFLKGVEMYAGFSLAWSPQGDLLGAGYWPLSDVGSRVSLWDPQTGELVRSKQDVEGLAWLPASDTIVSIVNDHSLKNLVFWNARTGEEIRKWGADSAIFDLAWSPDGKNLLFGEHHSLVVVDAETGEERHVLNGHVDSVTQVAWSPRGDLVAAASWDGMVIIWGINAPGIPEKRLIPK